MLSLTIKQLTTKLKNGSLAINEVFETCTQRAKLTKDLNAFVCVSDPADISSDPKDGVLKGVPVAVKDNFCTKSLPTTCASRMLLDFRPQYNATVVEKLESEGAILLGKSNLDEFAMGSGTVDSVHGPTKNVWGSPHKYTIDGRPRKSNPSWRVAGGSSGGSAVAVASGAVYCGIGSDSGGSTRNPASYCGVVGFKPTYSSVSRHGLIPLVNSMDVPGILTRNVEDAALVYNVICGEDMKDSTTVPVNKIQRKKLTNCSGLRVGIPMEYCCAGLSEEVHKVWEFVAHLLESNGATVISISMPHTAFSIACYSVLNQCEVASNMARFDGLRYGYRSPVNVSTEEMYCESRKALNQVVRGRILAGNYFLLSKNYEKYFEKALKVRRLIVMDFLKAWESVDFLLTPTTLTEAPLLTDFLQRDNREQSALNDYCTQPANMCGCPAVSLPIRLSSNELPLSVQLMAPNYEETSLISLAQFIEERVSFPKLEIPQ